MTIVARERRRCERSSSTTNPVFSTASRETFPFQSRINCMRDSRSGSASSSGNNISISAALGTEGSPLGPKVTVISPSTALCTINSLLLAVSRGRCPSDRTSSCKGAAARTRRAVPDSVAMHTISKTHAGRCSARPALRKRLAALSSLPEASSALGCRPNVSSQTLPFRDWSPAVLHGSFGR